MSTVTISVRGHSEARCAPERATVYFGVDVEGPEREPVRQRALALAAELAEELTGYGDAVEWHSETLSIWTDRPWGNEGQRLDPVHHAQISFMAKTADFELLGRLLDSLGEREGVSVSNVSWSLTDETRLRVEREQAVAAVAEATERAQAYAAALGLTRAEPVHLADVGLLGDAHAKGASADMMMARAMSAAPMGVELKPGEIQVAAGVEMRFDAT